VKSAKKTRFGGEVEPSSLDLRAISATLKRYAMCWVTLLRYGPEFEATLPMRDRTSKDGEFMNRSRTSRGIVCF
jgi:hypothetical protein